MKIEDQFWEKAKIRLAKDGTLVVKVDKETYMNTNRVLVESVIPGVFLAGTMYYMYSQGRTNEEPNKEDEQ